MTKIYDQASSLWKSVAKADIKGEFDLQKQLEIHSKLISIFQVGGYFYYIFNIKESEFDFVSTEIIKVLGYEPKEFNLAKYLEILSRKAQGETKEQVSKLIKFYEDGKISQLQTAENLINKLLSTSTRTQKAAVKKYNKTCAHHLS